MALYVLVFFGTTPVGGPLVGWCAQLFGPRSGILAGGLVSLAAVLATAVVQLRRAGGQVNLHLRPQPHLHVREPARDGIPAVELRVPAVRPAAR
jgi:hypothetical protein